MECPKCGSKTYVSNSIDKKYFVKRYRVCTAKRCKFRFTTTEIPESDWRYKNIVLKIRDLVKDVN